METWKALSLIQPWATLVVFGFKEIESRAEAITWKGHRGTVLIHASKSFPLVARRLCAEYPFQPYLKMCGIDSVDDLVFGAIIGKVDIYDCISTNSGRLRFTNDIEPLLGDYSPNRVGLLLRDHAVFDTPVPARGSLGLWNYRGNIGG
jgi:hypothetical protein